MDVHENRNVLGHRNGNGNDPDRDDVASVADSVMTQSSPWWSERSPVDLAHVLVADALTSAGLMLWQGEFTACLFVTSSWSASRTPGVGVGKQGEQCAGFGNANSLLAKPIAIALPFWIRLWQCVAQARHAAKTKARPSGHVSSSARDSSTLHLLNAVKYASCLAVIGCSVCIQMAELDGIRRGVGAWHGTFWNVSEDAWWKTWICLLCLKTAFTFAWDVVVDWGLARVGCDGRAARVGCLCPCCDDGLDSDMDTDGGGGDSDDERDSGDADAAGDSRARARPRRPQPAPSKVPPVPPQGAALRQTREVLRGGRVQLGGSHDVGLGHLAARVRGRVRVVAGNRGAGSTSGVDVAPGGERGDSNARREAAQAAVGDTKRRALREGVSELAAEPEPPGELGDEPR